MRRIIKGAVFSEHLSILVNLCPSQMKLWQFLTFWGKIEHALHMVLGDIVRRFQVHSNRNLFYIPG